MVVRRGSRRRRIWLEELEPRWLLSADIAPFAVPEAPFPESAMHEAVVDVLHAADPAIVAPSVPGRLELVFVDGRVPDHERLVADLLGQNDGWRRLEVVVLDTERDGIAQITEALASRLQLDAVHFIGHGTDGAVQLGGSWLDADAVAANEASVAGWGQSLKADGDLLFYGCDVAASTSGEGFLSRLASLTQADVAASADFTGAEALGGNWRLEFTLGVVESDVVVSARGQAEWIALLATQTLDFDTAVPVEGPWADNTFGPYTYDVDGVGPASVVITIGGDTGVFTAPAPRVENTVNGGTGQNAVRLQTNGLAAGQSATLTLDFSGYANGVSNVTFMIFDIDTSGDGTGFVDRVQVTANNGALINPTAVVVGDATLGGPGPYTAYNVFDGVNTVAGDTTVDLNSDSNAAFGNARFTFGASGITSITIDYSNTRGVSSQGVALHDISFDPTPAASNRNVAVNEDAVHTFAAAEFGFSDVDGDTLQAVRITSLETTGALKLGGVDVALNQVVAAASLGQLTFTPAADANGTPYASFRFQVSDGASYSVSDYQMTVNVNAVVDSVNDVVSTNEDNAVIVNVLANDNFEDVTRTLTGVSAPANGGVVFNATGSVTYTPNGDWNGTEVLTYTVTAGGVTETGTLTITVNAVNDEPSFTLVGNQSINEDAAAQTVAAFASGSPGGGPDEAGQTLAYAVSNDNSALFAAQPTIAANGTLSYTPTANASGTATASVFLTDNGGTLNGGIDTSAMQTFTINVTPVGDAPTLMVNPAAGNEDAAIPISISSSLVDTDGSETLAVTVSAIPVGATLTDGASTFTATAGNQSVVVSTWNFATLSVTPPLDSDTDFTLGVSATATEGANGAAATTNAALAVDVVPVNDAPVLATNAGLTVDEGAAITLTPGMLRATDVDNTAAQLVYSVAAAPANGRLERIAAPGIAITSFTQDDLDNGRIRYVHDGSETIADSFTFTVSDGAGGAIGATAFAITVNPVNDAPAITVNRLTLTDGQTVTLTLADLDATDPDNPGADLSFTVSGIQHGHFELAAAPGVAVSNFNYSQLAAGEVRFVHAGGNQVPAYTVTPSDLALAGAATPAQIKFNPAGDPNDGDVLLQPINSLVDDPLTVLAPPEPPNSEGDSLAFPQVNAPIPIPRGLESFDVLAPPADPVLTTPTRTALSATTPPGFAKTDPYVETESMDVLRLPGPVVGVELGKLDFDGPQGRSNIEVLLGMVKMSGLVLTVGAVWWATRAAGLLASALSSLPAWRNFDPIFVVGRDDDEKIEWQRPDEEGEREEEAVADALDAARRTALAPER